MDNLILDELINLNITLHSKVEKPKSIHFHLHDTYEVLFFISGNASYFVDNNRYPLKYGDIIITNTTEIHAPVFHSPETYERIIFHFSPHFSRCAGTPEYSLEKCFIDRANGKYNMASLNTFQINEFMNLYKNVAYLNADLHNENVILKQAKLMEILVFINNIFASSNDVQYLSNMPAQLAEVIKYINGNLSEDLCLKNLGDNFYLSKNYICTLFKKHTGKTIHQYIIYKRISYAKQLLISGSNVTEACIQSGFNDYSNFVKTYRKITGETPGSYRNNSLSH